MTWQHFAQHQLDVQKHVVWRQRVDKANAEAPVALAEEVQHMCYTRGRTLETSNAWERHQLQRQPFTQINYEHLDINAAAAAPFLVIDRFSSIISAASGTVVSGGSIAIPT